MVVRISPIDFAKPYRSLSDSHSVIERDVSREHSQSRARYSVPQRTPISTFACRAVHYVRPLRVFALCIWQAPRVVSRPGNMLPFIHRFIPSGCVAFARRPCPGRLAQAPCQPGDSSAEFRQSISGPEHDRRLLVPFGRFKRNTP